LQRPWFDRLAELTVPVTAVGAGVSASAIARRAGDAEIIDAAGGGVTPAPAAGRAKAAEAILRMLDRLRLRSGAANYACMRLESVHRVARWFPATVHGMATKKDRYEDLMARHEALGTSACGACRPSGTRFTAMLR
jgi:hypothetical protein